MKITLILAAASLLISPLPLTAQEKTGAAASATTVVVATGVGVDENKALRNAFRVAVEQAVGAVVDAETIVKNENVIKDQILTYSDGFVEKFDRVKEGKRDDGLYEVKIKAVVRRRQLIEKLKEAKVSVAKIEGESLFAEVVTQLDAEKNAAKLLEKALDGLPANLLRAAVTDSRPKILSKDESGIKAEWTIVVSFNYKDYETRVLPKLEQVLGDTAKRKSGSEIAQTAGSGSIEGDDWYRLPSFTKAKKYPLWKDDGYPSRPSETGPFDNQTELFLILNTGRNVQGNTRRWRWYVLDKDSIAPVIDRVAARSHFIKISFLGVNDDIVRESNVSLENESLVTDPTADRRSAQSYESAEPLFPWFLLCSFRGAPLLEVEIAPYVRARVPTPGNNGFRYGDALEYTFAEEFTLEEIKNIRQIRCSIVEKTKNGGEGR